MSAIDPGVEEGIKESADDVQSDHSGKQEEADDFLQPNHWWFASTASPLIAGTFGPLASGFNICALVQYWREAIPPGIGATEEDGHKIKDPTWLIVVNALSLAAALVGNGSLLLNMSHRVKFSIAQPTTIAGFLLASVLLIADLVAITSLPAYGITTPALLPSRRHALTQAYYYAIFAAAIYFIIGLLMCVTVYGAHKGRYSKDFHLTSPQRTLMLQTMAFITYLMLGALVFSSIEGWQYLDAVYWADVTLLTVGLGDYHPTKPLSRGLMFPFAIGGILMVGLVVGSIRSLILERGKEKLAARIVEKRRAHAVHNVDDRKQTIKISLFASADFSTDPALSPAQKREEEFNVMRKVQDTASRERRYFALATSSTLALILWFVGAVIFQQCEYRSEWSYLDSLYFAYTSLLTIGYGDFSPGSNSGKAFFVLWSLLAVPSLTILISNMGDTVIKGFEDLTVWVGSVTVLPGEGGVRATFRSAVEGFLNWGKESVKTFEGPGLFGAAPMQHEKRMESNEYENKMLDRMAERLTAHVDDEDHINGPSGDSESALDKDIQFYHYVLARECRNVQKDMRASPPKQYEWGDWEYYLKLMGNEDDPEDYPGQEQADILVPGVMKAPEGMVEVGAGEGGRGEEEDVEKDEQRQSEMDGNVDRRTSKLQHLDRRRRQFHHAHRRSKNPDAGFGLDWSWMSNESPLMSHKSEPEWILGRLSAALERELNRWRKGYRRKPPIGLGDVKRREGMEGGEDAEEKDEGKERRDRKEDGKKEEAKK